MTPLPRHVFPTGSRHGNPASGRTDRAEWRVRHVGNRAGDGAARTPGAAGRSGQRDGGGGDETARRADALFVDRSGRHHLDRHPQRHRRRGRAGPATGAVAADLRHGNGSQPHRGDRAGGGHHHLCHDRRRRTGAQTHRPARSRAHCLPGGAADAAAGAGGAAVRAPLVAVDRWPVAPAASAAQASA